MSEPESSASTSSTTTRWSGEGLRALLEAAGDIEVVGESGSAVEATAGSRRCAPTSRSSTPACPTAPGSRCAARSARSTHRSGA